MDKSKLPKELMSLPTPFLRCMLDNKYDGGTSEFTTTQLIGPPRKSHLKAQGNESLETPTGAYYSTLGTILHRILEDYSREDEGEIAERRLYAEIQGHTVSGQIDLYQRDLKCVSDWKFIGGEQTAIKPDHWKQLQINGRLAELNGWEVESVSICYFFRDWKMMQALQNPTYMQFGIKSFVVPYERDKAIALLDQCVKDHAEAKTGNPRDCSQEEKWEDPPTFAIIKNGGKRAISGGLCSTMAEAQEKLKPGHYIQSRKAVRKYCKLLCSYAHCCPQKQREDMEEASANSDF